MLSIKTPGEDVLARARMVRAEVASRFFSNKNDIEKLLLRYEVAAAELAQDLHSYPDCYLQPAKATDTRIVETIQRMQETLFGKADGSIPLRAVIQCDHPIVVPAEKAPRGQKDPLLDQIRERLTIMLDSLSREANPIPPDD